MTTPDAAGTADPGLLSVLADYRARLSNWGRWGADDEIGTANLITPERVKAAAADIVDGRVISIAMPIDQNGPQSGRNGRFNALRYSTSTGADHAAGLQTWNGEPLPHDVGFADDTIVMQLHTATHWDSLAHVFHEGRMYNGYPATEVSAEGARRNGSEALRASLVGPAVLLDAPRALGLDELPDGHAITSDELDATAAAQGVEVREGDIVLLRTGKLARGRREGWGSYAGGEAPGLSIHTAPWLHARGVAAVAADTWGVEVRPTEFPGAYQPLHIVAVVYMGMPFGEMFDLEELAAASAADGRYRSFISAPPLPITGTAGAPPGPVIIR